MQPSHFLVLEMAAQLGQSQPAFCFPQQQSKNIIVVYLGLD
jgi:hypothetical protein